MSAPKHNDGGPAFPCPVFHDPGRVKRADQPQGMSLRDYFAGQALAPVMAATNAKIHTIEAVGAAAYKFADAMIAAREVKP